MWRLMAMIKVGRLDINVVVTYRSRLDAVEDAYELFAARRDGVIKVAVTE